MTTGGLDRATGAELGVTNVAAPVQTNLRYTMLCWQGSTAHVGLVLKLFQYSWLASPYADSEHMPGMFCRAESAGTALLVGCAAPDSMYDEDDDDDEADGTW